MVQLVERDFDGAYPALDRKKVAKPHVVDGSNYLVDFDGPKSAFGYEKIYTRFNPSAFMQSFVVGTEVFYFSRDNDETLLQVSTLSWLSKQVSSLHRFISADLTRPKLLYPWTHAYVGSYHYFANRTWGVLRYDAINDNWEDVTATIGISDIFFITESDGRLCCLADGIVSWSAIDNGMDNTPSIATGAGFQALTIIGNLEQNTQYLGIQRTSRGFLVFTSKGCLRCEIIDSVVPFRSTPGETAHTPLNPWCLTKTTETNVVMLTRQGLYQSTDGVKFEEFQPLQNEFLKQVEIPAVQNVNTGYISLYYSIARDELYCSFAQSEVIGQYTKSWVLYVKREQWGSFDRVHKGFVFIDDDETGIQFDQAFVDTDGRLNYLNDATPAVAIESQNSRGIYVYPVVEHEPFQVEGVWQMPSDSQLTGFSRIAYPAVTAWYEENGAFETYKTTNETTNLEESTSESGGVVTMQDFSYTNSELIVISEIAQDAKTYSLDSFVEVGLFRFTSEQANDEMSYVTNMAISCLDVNDSTGSIFDDWLEDYPSDIFEDWNALTGQEDWGDSVASGSTYTQQFRGSLDGYETFEDQLFAPDEVQITGRTKFCSLEGIGIFTSLILRAETAGYSYHLKTLELNGNIAGRL